MFYKFAAAAEEQRGREGEIEREGCWAGRRTAERSAAGQVDTKSQVG